MKQRVFKYGELEFSDPDPNMSKEDVLRLVAASVPELAGGEIKVDNDDDGTEVVTFAPKAKRLG